MFNPHAHCAVNLVNPLQSAFMLLAVAIAPLLTALPASPTVLCDRRFVSKKEIETVKIKQRMGMEGRDHSKAQPVKSLETALQVLEVFDRGHSEWGVTELSEKVGVSKASIYRTLATLERYRYVLQNSVTGRYRLGSRLMQLGWAGLESDLVEEARPFMRHLRDETGEEVHLAVLDGGETVYMVKLASLLPVQVVSRIGDRSPAHCVAPGKVLLSHAPEDYLDDLIGRGLVCYTERTHATRSSLLRELRETRTRGYGVNWGEWRDEVRGVATPIMDGTRQVVASLAICAPAYRLTEEAIEKSVPLLTEAADGVSALLGATRVEGVPGAAADVADSG